MNIRKILLLQFICLLSVFYCHAGGNGSFTIGADVGPGFSSLYGSSSYTNSISNPHLVEASASAGINFRYNFPKIFSIGSGISYCQLGYNRYRWTDTILTGARYRGAWNTINIPLLARVSFGKKIVFFAEAGPFLGISLNRPYLLSGFYLYSGMAQSFWYSVNIINVGIMLGTGIQMPLPHHFALNFEACSNVGLENILLNEGAPSVKTYCCTLLCGFNYTLPEITRKQKIPDQK